MASAAALSAAVAFIARRLHFLMQVCGSRVLFFGFWLSTTKHFRRPINIEFHGMFPKPAQFHGMCLSHFLLNPKFPVLSGLFQSGTLVELPKRFSLATPGAESIDFTFDVPVPHHLCVNIQQLFWHFRQSRQDDVPSPVYSAMGLHPDGKHRRTISLVYRARRLKISCGLVTCCMPFY
jgi:hypothetical protein